MALPNNVRMLSKQILPEINIAINSNGVIISGERIGEPRFLRFDQTGKCRECKSTEVEIDYAITNEGVTVWSNRFRGTRFVPVDVVRDVPGHTFIKIKNKGRVFNVPYGGQKENEVPCGSGQAKKRKEVVPIELIDLTTSPTPSPPPKQPVDPLKKMEEMVNSISAATPSATPKNMEQKLNEDAQTFMNSISAATHFLDFAQRGKPVPAANTATLAPIQPNEEETMHAVDAQAFLDSLSAATHLLDFAQSGGSAAVQQQQQQMPPKIAEGSEPLAKHIKMEPEDYAEVESFMESIRASTFGLEGAEAAQPVAEKKEEEEEDSEDSDISSSSSSL